MMTLKVVFETKGIPKLFEEFIKAEFVRCYNIFADASESLYKRWYKEFDDTFGKLDNYDTPQCNRWLAKKAEAWCKNNITSRYMDFTFNQEVQMIGHVKGIRESEISFYLKEES